MKVKYVEFHNNYPFVVGKTYDALKHDDKWIDIDGQLYRIECFEFVGVLKSFVDYIDNTGCPPSNISELQREIIAKEYAELESKAAKWDMIQWAYDEGKQFVQTKDGKRIRITESDLEYLEIMYKEREQE